MVRVKHVCGLTVLLLAVEVVCPNRANAYLDPGSGSYVLQMAIAGLLVAGYTVKVYWRKIWARFARMFGRDLGGHDSRAE